MVIKGKCFECGKEYPIYDSMIDGVITRKNRKHEFSILNISENTRFNINLKYNFCESNFKTDKFEMIFIDIKKNDAKKYIRIYER